MELYWNKDHTAYAVLVSPGYGGGWSTWSSEERLAYDKKVVEWYLEHHGKEFQKHLNRLVRDEEYVKAVKFFENLGYPDVFFDGFGEVRIEWVPAGAKWRITEYDGAESLELCDSIKWNQFPNDEVK